MAGRQSSEEMKVGRIPFSEYGKLTLKGRVTRSSKPASPHLRLRNRWHPRKDRHIGNCRVAGIGALDTKSKAKMDSLDGPLSEVLR